jgi:cardiolipin synthase
MIGAFGLPAPTQAAVRFHADGGQALEALWRCVESARERLDVCTFLVANDSVGRELISRLALKATQGVRVRLLIDGAGVWIARHPSFLPLRRAGGEVALFHPLFGLRQHGPRNLRNHRKCVIADEGLLWSGGRNIAAEYFCGEARRPRAWVDLSFDLTGGVARVASRQFEMDWTHAHEALVRVSEPAEPVRPQPSALAQFLPSGPDQPEDTAHAVLIAACFRAKRRLLAVTPYFVPDEALLTAMRLAARRGISVTLVLPSASNHRLADFARNRALRILALAGVQILVVPYMLHAKLFIVDDDFAMTGSVNLDVRSLLLNYESAVAFYGKAEVAWLAAWIERIRVDATSWRVAPAGLLRDMAEGLLLTLAFQL